MEWGKYEGEGDTALTVIWMIQDMLKQVDARKIASFYDEMGEPQIAKRAAHGLEHLTVAELTVASVMAEGVMPVIVFAGPDVDGDSSELAELAAVAVEMGLAAQAERDGA